MRRVTKKIVTAAFIVATLSMAYSQPAAAEQTGVVAVTVRIRPPATPPSYAEKLNLYVKWSTTMVQQLGPLS